MSSQRTERKPSAMVGWSAAAALALALEAVVAVLAAGWWLWQIVQGHTSEVARTVVELVLFLLAAGFFAALARGLLRGARWPRTPTVLWHALLVPVAVSLGQSGEVVLCALVALVITLGILGVLLSRPTEG